MYPLHCDASTCLTGLSVRIIQDGVGQVLFVNFKVPEHYSLLSITCSLQFFFKIGVSPKIHPISWAPFCFFQIMIFRLKRIRSYRSNIISPIVPSTDHSQENCEILTGDSDSLDPLNKCFQSMYFASGTVLAAMWPRETRNRGHRRSLSSQAFPLWFRDRKRNAKVKGDPMSHCNIIERSSESDITVSVSLKRPKQAQNHEVNGAPIQGNAGKPILWQGETLICSVCPFSWWKYSPKTNVKLLSAWWFTRFLKTEQLASWKLEGADSNTPLLLSLEKTGLLIFLPNQLDLRIFPAGPHWWAGIHQPLTPARLTPNREGGLPAAVFPEHPLMALPMVAIYLPSFQLWKRICFTVHLPVFISKLPASAWKPLLQQRAPPGS